MGQGVEQDTGYLCDGGYLNAMCSCQAGVLPCCTGGMMG